MINFIKNFDNTFANLGFFVSEQGEVSNLGKFVSKDTKDQIQKFINLFFPIFIFFNLYY